MNKLTILIITALFVSGCVKNDRVENLRVQIESKKIKAVANIQETPQFKSHERYSYGSGGLKSPFRNTISELRTLKKSFTDIKPDENRIKSALEGYNLESIKMTGTIKGSKESSLEAIIETNDGSVYIVKVDEYIGENNGRVTSINKNSIELEEIISNGSYRWLKRPAKITMIRDF